MKKIGIVFALLVSAIGYGQIDVVVAEGLQLEAQPSTLLNGLSNPAEGLLVGNTTTKSLWYYNGSEFVDLMALDDAAQIKINFLRITRIIDLDIVATNAADAIKEESDPIFIAWDKDYNDLINRPSSLGGKSAYELAVDNGYVGTEAQWLNSLMGDDGANGAKGDTGEGVPTGGLQGQILAKKSTDDYDTQWVDAQFDGNLSQLDFVQVDENSPQDSLSIAVGTNDELNLMPSLTAGFRIELATDGQDDSLETVIQGAKGEKGDTGLQGPQGIQGETGPQGVQGSKGDKGDMGETGPQGPEGSGSATSFNDIPGNLFTVTGTAIVADSNILLPVSANDAYSASWDNSRLLPTRDAIYDKIESLELGSGTQGPPGPKGDKGDTGDTGPQGPAGTSYSLPYKTYVARVSQNGTSAPAAYIMQNDTSGFTWSRISTGVYQCTPISQAQFNSAMTTVSFHQQNGTQNESSVKVGISSSYIQIACFYNTTLIDSNLNGHIEIRQYN